MNVLITGGAGFIGSNLAVELHNKGHKVAIIDRKSKPDNLKEVNNGVSYFEGDVRDNTFINSILANNRIDGVVHLAAVSRVVWGQEDPDECVDINTNGTRNLLENIKDSTQRPWFIFGSSREIYGECKELPVCEHFKKMPINIYGETKIDGEALVDRYTRELGLRSTILRFSNVYGNEKDILDRVLPCFIISALKGEKIEIHGGNQLIDFTHITDTVDGILRTIDILNKKQPNFIDDFHLLTGKGTTLQEAVEIISNSLEKKPEIVYTDPRDYDVDRFIGNPVKAQNVLGFKADILPEEGIPLTIDRYREVFGL